MSLTVTGMSQGEGGNTNSPSPANPLQMRKKRWIFTLNNPKKEDLSTLAATFHQKKCLYSIGKEIGANGTPHLQGYLEFKNVVRFASLKRILPKAHIEAAKGDRASNLAYTQKDGDYVSSFPSSLQKRLLSYYDDVRWREWQKGIIDLLEGEPNNRKVHWYWEETGNVGKSFLAKYLVLKFDAIIADGKKDNVFNQVKIWMEENPNQSPKAVIVDCPRSSQNFLNYGVLEQLKNGMIYSGKYEGGKCLFECPHVLVFANAEPERHAMSADRWDVHHIFTGNPQ